MIQNASPRMVDVPPRRYKIGELAASTGLTRQTLHNYTHWGLIQEAGWTAGGHRFYDESVFHRLAAILDLKPTHTIDEIRAALAASHPDASHSVTESHFDGSQ